MLRPLPTVHWQCTEKHPQFIPLLFGYEANIASWQLGNNRLRINKWFAMHFHFAGKTQKLVKKTKKNQKKTELVEEKFRACAAK